MFDSDEITAPRRPATPSDPPVVKLGILDRGRVVNHVAKPYQAFREAADIVNSLHPELGEAVLKGGEVPPGLSRAVYDYELARAQWQAVWTFVRSTFGRSTSDLILQELRDRHGGKYALKPEPPEPPAH